MRERLNLENSCSAAARWWFDEAQSITFLVVVALEVGLVATTADVAAKVHLPHPYPSCARFDYFDLFLFSFQGWALV